MRYNRRYTRVLSMITAPEVPRRADGGLAICRFCQRDIYWHGGFLKMLARQLEIAAARHWERKRRCKA